MRIKHTLDSKSLYTTFATQEYAKYGPSDNYAQNSSGNRSFRGIHVVSYSTVIGKRHFSAEKGPLVLITTNDYSVTTRKQKYELFRACYEASVDAIEVPEFLPDTGLDENVKYLADLVKESLLKFSRARVRYSKLAHLTRSERQYTDLLKYTQFFDLQGRHSELLTELACKVSDARMDYLLTYK